MSWVADTLEDFKTWLGGTPDDAAATRALTLALVTVETWLDRPLEKLERVQDDWPTNGVVWLRAWPVESVASIVWPVSGPPPIDVTRYELDKRTGRVGFFGGAYHVVTTYTGGYDPMPVDLELALWQVAAALYPTAQSAGGASTGQAIKRVTTPDVGTVEFATNGVGGEADAILGATLSPQIESLLQRYRAESVVGGA